MTIYLILTSISVLYFLLLYKNYGETIQLAIKNTNTKLIFIILFIGVIILFFKDSGILNKQEYDRLLEKHQQIRDNIVVIKKNIPTLKAKLTKEPNYYEGWVMLAKSYIITDNLLLAADAYETAMSINMDDNSISIEYIDTLRKIDSKSYKSKIVKVFDELIYSNPSDISIYNMKLNYSIEINDVNLTKEILGNIIDSSSITDKNLYIQALKKLNESLNQFSFEIKLSDQMYGYLKSNQYLFFILKDKDYGPPFAVKKINNIDLGKNIVMTSQDTMIKGLNLPKNIMLLIKGNKNDVVDGNMAELYKSKKLDFQSNISYKVD